MKTAQKKKPFQPKTRDQVTLAMIQRGGDGFHSGHKRAENRRDRKRAKLDLRRFDY